MSSNEALKLLRGLTAAATDDTGEVVPQLLLERVFEQIKALEEQDGGDMWYER